VSTRQLEDCLDDLEKRRAAGEDVRLGELLILRGVLSPRRFLDSLGLHDVGLRVCLGCGRVYDASAELADSVLRCLKCGAELGAAPAEAKAARKGPATERPAVQKPGDTRPRLGKYVLAREIGRGGVAVVYEAEDPELKRRVAVKVIRESDASPRLVDRLHREAAIAAQLRHPSIVGIHEVSMVRDELGQPAHFIAMDLVEGTTLAHLLDARGVDRGDLLRMLEDTARAVAFAHSKGVVHRDLKPSNVLIDASGRVVLTDFGVARAETFDTKLTRTHAVMGTPQYMAPEQALGRTADIDPRTDVYALGVMLFEIVAGLPPFEADSAPELYRRMLDEDPPPLGDPELDAVARKAMEKAREDRYPGADAFADDLARFRRAEPVHARPANLVRRVRRRFHRHRALLVPTLVAVCLGVAMGAVAVAEITGVADPRGVPFVVSTGLFNLAVVVFAWWGVKKRR
jgi:serine/threonine-protein kinase